MVCAVSAVAVATMSSGRQFERLCPRHELFDESVAEFFPAGGFGRLAGEVAMAQQFGQQLRVDGAASGHAVRRDPCTNARC